MGLKVVLISCLFPWKELPDSYEGRMLDQIEHWIGVPPIYDFLVRQQIEQLGKSCQFYTPKDICREMNGYYEQQPEFIN